MKDEGPAQWTLARAEQASVVQRVMGAFTNNLNFYYQNDGDVN